MPYYVYDGNREIPGDYQAVEYIESTGTQYIDTGISPSNIVPIVKLKIKTSNNNINEFGVFGAYGPDDTRFQIYFNSIGIGTFNYITLYPNTEYVFELNGKVPSSTMNGVTVTTGYTKENGFTSLNLLLFTRNNVSVDTGLPMKLYYCQIYNDNKLVRNFIPCYRKSDNVIGMYDLVNGVFYTNDGTGTFTKGNDLPYKNSVYLIKDNNKSMNIGG